MTELTRGEIILRGALAAGAAYGLGAIGPFARRALAADGGGDLEILNFLLPFEYLQVQLYERGRGEVDSLEKRVKLSRGQKRLVEMLLSEERQHLDALRTSIERLGGEPVAKSDHDFVFSTAFQFFGLAGVAELSAVGIYNGLLPEIESSSVKELAGSIAQVEGRHAATVNLEREEEPAPQAFELALTRLTATSATEKFTPID